MASVILMVVDQRFHATDPIRQGMAFLLYPVAAITDMPGSVGSHLTQSIKSRRELEDELTTLKARQFSYDVRLQKVAALEQENIRLRRLLESTYSIGERTLIAQLLRVEMDPYKQVITLDKGSYHGVLPNQPMLDSKGVVGQILRTNDYYSTGLLITDPSHAIPVQINRNGLRTIAVGTGVFDELELLHIPNNGDIAIGDLLVTSGLGGVFPANYPVAKITGYTPQPDRAFAKVTAKPLAELDRIREVLLIWEDQYDPNNASPEDTPNDTATTEENP